MAEVAHQHRCRDLGDRARHLHPGRSAADQHEGEEPPALGLVRGGLRLLEGEEQAAADRGRVVERLEARRDARPALRLVPEIAVFRAGGEDEVVEGPAAVAGQHAPARDVDADRLVEHDLGVPLPTQHATDRRRDVGRRERGRRDLVEQRLEQMVIAAIDHRHVDRRVGEPLGGGEAAEAGADDHDARPRRRARDPLNAHECPESERGSPSREVQRTAPPHV
jgi:hypothetical protein